MAKATGRKAQARRAAKIAPETGAAEVKPAKSAAKKRQPAKAEPEDSKAKPGKPSKPAAAASRAKAAARTEAPAATARAAADAPAPPIDFDRLKEMLADPATPRAALAPYLYVWRDPQNGRLTLRINEELVRDARPEDLRTRGFGMDIANGLERSRRRARFLSRLGDKTKILLAEGDSWFEYPFFLDDTIDDLNRDFNCFCLSAAGDTLASMAESDDVFFYFHKLVKDENLTVAAVLLSGGGNDLVGDQMRAFLKPYKTGAQAKDLIDQRAYDALLDKIEGLYVKLIKELRTVNSTIPILVHGYDYAIPLPDQSGKGSLLPLDGWLGEPMRKMGIVDATIQRAIVRIMIDGLYGRLGRFANATGTAALAKVFLVDNRGVVKGRWHDELHPTDAGFAAVAANFEQVLRVAGVTP